MSAIRIPWRVRNAWECCRDFLRDPGPHVNRLGFLKPRRRPPSVSFFPEFTDEAEFLDAYHKAAYFLPEGVVDRVVFPVAFDPGFPLETPGAWPKPDYVADMDLPAHRKLQVMRTRRLPALRALLSSDYVFVWDRRALGRFGLLASGSKKLQDVDRHRHINEGWIWGGFMSLLEPEETKAATQRLSQERFLGFLDALPRYEKCYVFGTGPSLEQAWKHDFSDGYRIVCNTIVRNGALLDHIAPHFICAGDAAYHFGNNHHAYRFRRDLEQALDGRDALFITRDNLFPLFLHHHPSLSDKSVAAEFVERGIEMDYRRRLVYLRMGNILNCLMLPLASSIARDIRLLGFDGRAPGEKVFWQNWSRGTYDDLKPSIRAAHPAFFSEMNYEKYARQHGENADRIMAIGESRGKEYVCMNPSHVPAFQKRYRGEE
ncbi:hypothetical protein ACFLSJ_03050 [Verrucomicrobiota bacterium]